MTIHNPYRDTSIPWLRGNLHAHTTMSDGDLTPQDLIDQYAARGYDFLAISDHDILTDASAYNALGMTLIPANEVTVNGPHTVHVGATAVVPPDPNRLARDNAGRPRFLPRRVARHRYGAGSAGHRAAVPGRVSPLRPVQPARGRPHRVPRPQDRGRVVWLVEVHPDRRRQQRPGQGAVAARQPRRAIGPLPPPHRRRLHVRPRDLPRGLAL